VQARLNVFSQQSLKPLEQWKTWLTAKLGTGRERWVRVAFLVMAISLLGLIFYFSWVPDPAMQDQKWLPRWLRTWADRYDQLRTAVPLVPLGFIGGLYLAWRRSPLPHWLLLWCTLSNLVLLAELGQVLLPRRRFDLMDVFWGSAGAAVGVGSAGWLFYQILKRRTPENP